MLWYFYCNWDINLSKLILPTVSLNVSELSVNVICFVHYYFLNAKKKKKIDEDAKCNQYVTSA